MLANRYVLIEAMSSGRIPAARSLIALSGLSLLWALDSLRGDLFPNLFHPDSSLPPFESLGLHWGLLAAGAAIAAVVRRSGRPGARLVVEWTLLGIALFAAPGLILETVASHVPQLTRVALFALTPCFAVVLEPYLGVPDRELPRHGLPAALTALAGVLLLFPFELPSTPAQAAGFVAVVLAALLVAAAGCRAVRAANEFDSVAPCAAWAAAAASVVFLAACLISEPTQGVAAAIAPQAIWSLLLDLPALLLFFWLLRRVTAAQHAMRLILAPLFTSLLSLILFLPPVSLRAAAGLALMVAGAAWMLWPMRHRSGRPESLSFFAEIKD